MVTQQKGQTLLWYESVKSTRVRVQLTLFKGGVTLFIKILCIFVAELKPFKPFKVSDMNINQTINSFSARTADRLTSARRAH